MTLVKYHIMTALYITYALIWIFLLGLAFIGLRILCWYRKAKNSNPSYNWFEYRP